jgi:methylated-DNA-[protein]-cysteine S-methyltransferase
MYCSATYPSPVGVITLACDGGKLAGLWMEGQKYHGDTISEIMTEKTDMPIFDTAKK